MKDIDFRNDPAAEREWQAQERGEGRYAAVLRAAGTDVGPTLPAGFAGRVADVAEARRRAAGQPARLEAWLIGVLLAILLASAVPLVFTNEHALETLRQPWLLGLAGCLALSQALALLRPLRTRSEDA
ncbi:hypothetical protein KPL74_15690 [Bacillus sp. NP157]|nr:hypothetical protein KPL74_15690 [Bacillus sp. NP157]